jgi:hypothetical protein
MILLRLRLQQRETRGHNKMAPATFDLGTFSKVPLTFVEVDANGNLVTPGVAPVVTSSDETIAVIVDDGAGNKSVARVAQTAGSVTVTATVTNADGSTATGTLALTLAAVGGGTTSNVADITIVPGIPE